MYSLSMPSVHSFVLSCETYKDEHKDYINLILKDLSFCLVSISPPCEISSVNLPLVLKGRSWASFSSWWLLEILYERGEARCSEVVALGRVRVSLPSGQPQSWVCQGQEEQAGPTQGEMLQEVKAWVRRTLISSLLPSGLVTYMRGESKGRWRTQNPNSSSRLTLRLFSEQVP